MTGTKSRSKFVSVCITGWGVKALPRFFFTFFHFRGLTGIKKHDLLRADTDMKNTAKTMNNTSNYEPLDFSDYDYHKERFAGSDPSPTYEEFLEEERDRVIEEKARREALTDKEREAEDARIAKILSDEAEAKAAYDLKWADCPF